MVEHGGSPAAPEVIRRTREILPGTRLVQVYGLSETGFLATITADTAERRDRQASWETLVQPGSS